MHWGYHLIIDCAECNDNINSVSIVKEFITNLVPLLKMYPIGPPTVVYIDSVDGQGVSGVQLITTSTITFHGDNAGKCAFIDVFSCQRYNPHMVLEFIRSYFAPKQMDHRWIYRDAPKNTK